MSIWKKSHLRLVSCQLSAIEKNAFATEQDSSASGREKNEGEVSLLLLSEADVLQSDYFVPYLRETNACCLFDVRVAPRLDFIAPSRLQAFRKFAELGVDYVDVIGRIAPIDGNDVMPEAWVDLVCDKIQLTEKAATTIVFIFDNSDMLCRARNVLSSTIDRFCAPTRLHIEAFPELSSELLAM